MFKKAYLQIWKYLGQPFAHTLFKYLRKHAYESENTFDNLLFIPFSNITNLKNTSFYTNINVHKIIIQIILIKIIIQIGKHKAKYIITACIPIIIIKKILLFFFTIYKNERRRINFNNNIKKSEFYNKNKEIFNINDIDVNKI